MHENSILIAVLIVYGIIQALLVVELGSAIRLLKEIKEKSERSHNFIRVVLEQVDKLNEKIGE